MLIGQGVPPDLIGTVVAGLWAEAWPKHDNETVAIPGRPSAAWLVARRRLGHRWRSWVLLALLTGVASGAVIGAMAGARRTASVYDRLVAATDPYEVAFAPGCPSSDPGACEPSAPGRSRGSCRSPRSRSSGTLHRVRGADHDGGRPVGATRRRGLLRGVGRGRRAGFDRPRAFTTIQRPHLVKGRRADPDRADEVLLSEITARRVGIDVGDRLEIVPVSCAAGGTREDWPAPIEVTVAGIHLAPGEVEPQSGFYTQTVVVTRPTLSDSLRPEPREPPGAPSASGAARRLMTSFAAAEAAGVDIGILLDQSDMTADVEDGLRTDSTTLWLLAGFAAVAAVVVLGQALTRQVWGGAEDFGTLRALGHTTRDLAAVGAVEGAALGVMGGAAAVVAAVAVSPLAPIGRARQVETDPGVRIDGLVLALGVIAVVVIAIVAVALATWWVAGRLASRRGSSEQPTLVASLSARAHLWPSATCGVRMALERGSGRAAVPVWSGVGCTILGAAALIGTITFAAGLDHLRHTPRVVGWNWDLMAFSGIEPGDPPTADPLPRLEPTLDRARGIAGVERVTYGSFFAQPPGLIEGGPEGVSVMSLAGGPD